MTKIEIGYQRENVLYISASGHADSAPHGEDIVCAAISVLMQTLVNSLEEVGGFMPLYTIDEDGYIAAKLPKSITDLEFERAQVIFNTIIVGLKGIEEVYPEYIKLLKMEVER